MVQRKGSEQVKRRVWQTTPNAPQGEHAVADEVAAGRPRPADQVDKAEPGWLMSSFELTHGVEVTDETDTIPGELFDELFVKK